MRKLQAATLAAVTLFGGCAQPLDAPAESSSALSAAPTIRGVDEWRAAPARTDARGGTHTRLTAYHRGVRVPEAGVVIHGGTEEGLTQLSWLASGAAPPFVDPVRRVGAAAAEQAARRALPWTAVVTVGVDEIYVRDGDHFEDVYEVVLSVGASTWHVRVDAETGAVAQVADASRGVGIGHSLYHGDVPVQSRLQDGVYFMEDPNGPTQGFNTTYSEFGPNGVPAPSSEPGYVFFDDDDVWGNGQTIPFDSSLDPMGPYGQSAAVDAAWAMAAVWRFYLAHVDAGGPLRDHLPTNVAVRHYRPSQFSLSLRTAYLESATATCGDDVGVWTVGHELSHGYFDVTVYPVTGNLETDALAEANSNIMGKLIEDFAANGDQLSEAFTHWSIMDEVCPQPLYYMDRPSKDGHSFDAWSPDLATLTKDPHYAAGPIDRMFYFLVNGVTPWTGAGNPDTGSLFLQRGFHGIGMNEAMRVYVDAFENRRVAPATPTFMDLRTAMEDAARAWHSTTDLKAVDDAFAAVNVGPPADRDGPIVRLMCGALGPSQPCPLQISDASGVRSTQYYLDGVSIGGQSNTLRGWQVLIPAATKSGIHSLRIDASDIAGNKSSTTFSVTVDNTGPLTGIQDTTPKDPSHRLQKIFHVNASDPAGVAKVHVTLSPSFVIGPGGVPPVTDLGTKTAAPFDFPAGFTDVSPTAWTVTAVATDGAGNSTSSSILFSLDRDQPVITSTQITDWLAQGVEHEVTFTVCGQDVSGVREARIILDGLELARAGAAAPPSTPRCIAVVATGVAFGAHTVELRLSDVWGNEAMAGPQTYTLHGFPPTIKNVSWYAVTDSTKLQSRVVAWVDDNKGVSQVTILVDQSKWSAIVNAPVPGTDRYEAILTGVPTGQHTVSVYARDTDGQFSHVDLPMYLEYPAPTPPPSYYSEREPNDGLDMANYLPANALGVQGSEQPFVVGDYTRDVEDVFMIDVAAGGRLGVTVAGACAAQDAGFGIADAAGNDLANPYVNATGVTQRVYPYIVNFGFESCGNPSSVSYTLNFSH